ncbi:MAG: PAS domain S-box-containing protein, partial [Myxococcota bacterium]
EMRNTTERTISFLAWVDQLIPDALLHDNKAISSEVKRRARLLLFVVAASGATSFIYSIAHFLAGEQHRAFLATFALLPIAFTLYLLHRTATLYIPIHYLCTLLAACVVASPFLTESPTPIFVGLISIPLAAATVGGIRAGLAWTAIATALLAAGAMYSPLSQSESVIAWSTTIMAAVCGVGISIADYVLARAVQSANRSREQAVANSLERRQAESDLVDSQALFAAAFRRAPAILVLTVAETGEVLDVNEQFCQLIGYSREEVIGGNLVKMGVWPSPSARKNIMKRVQHDGTLSTSEIPIRTRDGRPLCLLGSTEPIKMGGQLCLLCQGMDITERKRTDNLLEQQRLQLEHGLAERGEQLRDSREQLRLRERLATVGTLAAGIAHQINNPIGGIVAASEFALLSGEDEDAPEIRQQALETALDEARRCGRIVKSILQFSRDEQTSKWVEDLNPIVRRASELARNYVQACGGELHVETTDESLLVMVSPINIEQAILNLVRNAAESRPGGASVLVQTTLVRGSAEIAVTDNGNGINEKARPRVFDPFYTTRLETGGTGLGLSVVHGVVGDHAGKLEIESPPFGGTCFRVILPIASGEERR